MKDPVCRMDVNEAETELMSEYQAKNYYFCNVSCKVIFDENPEKYIE